MNKSKKKVKKDFPVNEMATFLNVFGDPTRLNILFALDKEELNVTELCNILNMSKSAISHQLKVLKDNSIVKYVRNGKNVTYSLDDDHVSYILKITREHISED